MIEAAVLLFFPILVVFAAWSDLLTMTISNRVSMALVAGFFPLAYLAGATPETMLLHLSCGAVVLAISFVLFCLHQMGGGDAKLTAAIAVWFGWGHVLEFALIFSVLGGFLTLGLLFVRTIPLPPALMRHEWIARLHDRETGIPYGIALAIAGLLIYPETIVWLLAAAT